jgi:PAS domain S-box-containing protein
MIGGVLYHQFKVNKQNSDFLDKVINSLPHPFVVINAENYQIELMNKSAQSENLNIVEYDEKKGRYFRKKNAPYDLDEIIKNKKDEMVFSEFEVNDTRGSRYYEIHAYAIKDNSNNVKKIIEYAFNITERKKAAEKIKRSETKFRSLFEGASDAIAILKDHKFVQCNKQALKLYGVSENELIGRSPLDFSPEYQRDGTPSADLIKEKIDSVLQGNNSFFVWRQIKKNGEIFDAEISLSPLKLDDEIYVQAIIRDITKRLQTQRALEESEAKNSAILQAIPDIMFVFDSKGEYKEIHTTNEDDLIRPAQKLLGNTIRDMIPKKEAEIFYYYIEKAFETGEIQRFEYDLKIGEQRKYFEARLIVMEEDRVLCIVRNYSKQKEAELALKKSEENFRMVVEDQTELICRLNKEGNMTFVNQSLCRYLGAIQEELLGTKLNRYLMEEDLKMVKENLAELTFEKPIVVQEHRMIIDDEVRWTEWTDRKLFDENREFIGYQAVGRDITERKKAEEKLKQTNRELKALQADLQRRVDEAIKEIREKDHLIIKQSRQAAMGEMIGNIAHQWRQPLAAVAAIVQSFEDAYEDGELDADYIEEKTDMMMDLLQHMSRTIDDFRNFFKPNKVKESFSLKENIKKTTKLIASSFKNNNIELQLELAEDINIEGYPNEFSQVILNILNNAKDAFEANEISDRKVKISIHKKKRKNIISIEDNAGGIKDKILDKIFDPYFTTKHQSAGTGLGLYMSKMIVEKNMDGHLEVKTWPGGTRFDIIL